MLNRTLVSLTALGLRGQELMCYCLISGSVIVRMFCTNLISVTLKLPINDVGIIMMMTIIM